MPRPLLNSLAAYFRSLHAGSSWTLERRELRVLPPLWPSRASIVSAAVVATLLLVSGCLTDSSVVVSDFCLIYKPMPPGSLGSVEISREALRVIVDNEVAYYDMCG